VIGDFLKPPTDNLYKFMCIVGLILFLVSVTYPPWLLHRSTLALLEAQRDSELLQLEADDETNKHQAFMKQAKDEIAEGDVQISRLKAISEQGQNKSRLSTSERTAINREIEAMEAKHLQSIQKREELYKAAQDAALEVQKHSAALRYKTRIITWESWYGRIAMVLCIAGLILGAVLGRKGFNLWSLRVQVYQDAILKKQAEQETAQDRKSGEAEMTSPPASD